MPKRTEGPVKSKSSGYYFMDEYIGFPPDVRRIRYSLKTKDKGLATTLWRRESRKLWGAYYRLTSPKRPNVDWHVFHPHKKPKTRNPDGSLSKETRKKISMQKSGEYHPQWRGGISYEPYGIEFNRKAKNRIRKRDKYTCAACKAREDGRQHSVHHIDYNKQNNNPSNLITLCVNCHALTNANRETWTNFFWSLVEITSLQRKAKSASR